MRQVEPVSMSKWLGLAYALVVASVLLWGVDAPDVALLQLLVFPWIVGPAAFAALGSKLSGSHFAAWAFFGLEALIIGSTGWLWFDLIVVAPDAQNGIAMLLFPAFQYAGVALFFLLAFLLGWRGRQTVV